MSRQRTLRTAEKAKRDEFYTLYKDIENELKHYHKHLEGKIIYMNADDMISNFWKYFYDNFHELKLKEIIATGIHGSKYTYDGDNLDVEMLNDGRFQSDEAIEILKRANIVVTNPPFSQFREFVNLMITHEKEFIIIGNNNAITYKEIFPLIRDNKMWLGVKSNTAMTFEVPSYYTLNKNGFKENGIKYLKVPSISWFTNIAHDKRNEDIPLTAEYSNEYDVYDNYNAINVNSVKAIPKNYYDVMGVPITFLSKWNPEQFELVGLGINKNYFTPTKYYENAKKHTKDKTVRCGSINQFLMIKRSQKPAGAYYTADNVDGYLVAPYARLLIKRKV